jgi:hypothetical protein
MPADHRVMVRTDDTTARRATRGLRISIGLLLAAGALAACGGGGGPEMGVHDVPGGPADPDVIAQGASAVESTPDDAVDDAVDEVGKPGWQLFTGLRGVAVEFPGTPEEDGIGLIGTDVDADAWWIEDPDDSWLGVWAMPAFTNDLRQSETRVIEMVARLTDGATVVSSEEVDGPAEAGLDTEQRFLGTDNVPFVCFHRVVALEDGRVVVIESCGPEDQRDSIEADFKHMTGSFALT